MSKKQKSELQAARLALFDSPTGYEEKYINGEWYVKSWNGNSNKWQVAVYSERGFRKYKRYSFDRLTKGQPWYCCGCGKITGYDNFPTLHTNKSHQSMPPATASSSPAS